MPSAKTIAQAFAAHRERLTLWLPVAMMVGIGAYFRLDGEPPPYTGPLLLSLCIVLLGLSWGKQARFPVMVLFMMALGFTCAQYRSHAVATPMLASEMHYREVEGTIDEIEPVEKKEKLVLSRLVIEDLPQEKTPLRIRVSFRHLDPQIRVGDRVRFHATLFPLPQPPMPGAYDFARHFYFRSIGGNGFAMRAPERVQSAGQDGFDIFISNLRHAIGEDMRAGMPGATGTVAAAMTVGEMGPIPEDTKTALRDSGLAHMLSISGLHLGIAAGIVFYNLRLLLALMPSLALRLPVKKIAAVVAILSAGIYLMLAGESIPAQRAFIMVVFLFAAVMLDRQGITLRTLCIAATLILLLFPESMFGASFQMSFAATLAIIALFEGAAKFLFGRGGGWLSSIARHAGSIALSSLVATLATAPFVLYHFNRFALLGLIANMAVIPLATFVIMPGMVLALLLMPFGLQWIGYVPLGLGTQYMIAMAHWVTSLPYALWRFASPTDAGLLAACFGLIWTCLMRGRWRWLGVAVELAGLSTIALHEPVDVFISRDAHQLMVRLEDGRYTTLKGTGRSFTVQNWLRSEGQEEIVPLKQTGLDCDKNRCAYERNGRSLVFVRNVKDERYVKQACGEKTDILVAWRYLHPQECPAPVTLIGRAELEARGSHTVIMGSEAVRIRVTRDENKPRRIWQPAYNEGDEEEF